MIHHDYSIRFFFSFIQIFFWLIVIGVFDGIWIPSAVSERFTTNKQSTDCTVRERRGVDRARFVFTCVACIDYVFFSFLVKNLWGCFREIFSR